MKFNCDRVEDWCRKHQKQRVERLAKMQRWFAWRPVVVGHGDCRWLEVVVRRRVLNKGFDHSDGKLVPSWYSWKYYSVGFTKQQGIYDIL